MHNEGADLIRPRLSEHQNAVSDCCRTGKRRSVRLLLEEECEISRRAERRERRRGADDALVGDERSGRQERYAKAASQIVPRLRPRADTSKVVESSACKKDLCAAGGWAVQRIGRCNRWRIEKVEARAIGGMLLPIERHFHHRRLRHIAGSRRCAAMQLISTDARVNRRADTAAAIAATHVAAAGITAAGITAGNDETAQSV